ncbi:MAG: hypothetical protein IPK54_07960 [Dokdonella sp.]|uniref:hypothetical protein n=1 Tax=Dokdonella sp. TaxID=2291710 RepID=UPI0025C2AE12|nr:hypothetical protein [Dokdonella sp.]MBK8123474.1 hypothetical protein [Dokdonella sp.]
MRRRRTGARAGGRLSAFDQDAYRPDEEDALLDSAGLASTNPALHRGEVRPVDRVPRLRTEPVPLLAKPCPRKWIARWDDVYGTVVLYPQTRSSYLPLNPKARWDWWGYPGH